MKRFFLLLLPVVFGLASGGCALDPANHSYHRVELTDARGDLVAIWTTEGRIWHVDEGYKINAVERRAFDPPVLIRYPHGRIVTVSAAHVSVLNTTRPEWMDSGEFPDIWRSGPNR